jgi:dsDNA-binding SOS-regulon protein
MEEVNKNTEVDNTDKKLHISDVMSSFLTKLQSRLVELEKETPNMLFAEGRNFGKREMIEEIMEMVID